MSTRLRRALALAAATTAALTMSLVAGGASPAVASGPKSVGDGAASTVTVRTAPVVSDGASTAAGCLDNHVCFYVDTNYRTLIHQVPDYWFYDCTIVLVEDGVISSIRNYTRYDLELWDLSASPDYLIGTAARHKSYGYFGARGNDTMDSVASPPCIN